MLFSTTLVGTIFNWWRIYKYQSILSFRNQEDFLTEVYIGWIHHVENVVLLHRI